MLELSEACLCKGSLAVSPRGDGSPSLSLSESETFYSICENFLPVFYNPTRSCEPEVLGF